MYSNTWKNDLTRQNSPEIRKYKNNKKQFSYQKDKLYNKAVPESFTVRVQSFFMGKFDSFGKMYRGNGNKSTPDMTFLSHVRSVFLQHIDFWFLMILQFYSA